MKSEDNSTPSSQSGRNKRTNERHSVHFSVVETEGRALEIVKLEQWVEKGLKFALYESDSLERPCELCSEVGQYLSFQFRNGSTISPPLSDGGDQRSAGRVTHEDNL